MRAADLPFCMFVLGLGIVVKAVVDNGLGTALAPLLPAGTSLPALLAGLAGVAARRRHHPAAATSPSALGSRQPSVDASGSST